MNQRTILSGLEAGTLAIGKWKKVRGDKRGEENSAAVLFRPGDAVVFERTVRVDGLDEHDRPLFSAIVDLPCGNRASTTTDNREEAREWCDTTTREEAGCVPSEVINGQDTAEEPSQHSFTVDHSFGADRTAVQVFVVKPGCMPRMIACHDVTALVASEPRS